MSENLSLAATLSGIEKKIQSQSKVKACLFNLVIDVQCEERSNYYKKVVQELIDYFPCRIFLIHFSEGSPRPEIKFEALSPKSSPGLVCDLFELHLSSKESDSIRSLLLSQFVSDLPIFYLPTEHGDHLHPFTYWMASLAQKVISDSTDVVDMNLFIENLERFYHQGIEVSDLNWSRVESWRDIIAKNLNDEIIHDLKKIEVVYCLRKNAPKQHPFQALYLKEFLSIKLAQIGKSVPVELKGCEEAKIWPGAILSVNFSANSSTKQSFVRNLNKPEEAIIHFESASECYLPAYVQFTKTETGQSLVKEIKHGQSSFEYVQVLEKLKKSKSF